MENALKNVSRLLGSDAAEYWQQRFEPMQGLPGMKAKVILMGDELRDVILVPSNAVSSSGARHTVNVSKDGKAAPREVTPGKTDGKMIHIKKGLEAGEKIVLPKP